MQVCSVLHTGSGAVSNNYQKYLKYVKHVGIYLAAIPVANITHSICILVRLRLWSSFSNVNTCGHFNRCNGYFGCIFNLYASLMRFLLSQLPSKFWEHCNQKRSIGKKILIAIQ